MKANKSSSLLSGGYPNLKRWLSNVQHGKFHYSCRAGMALLVDHGVTMVDHGKSWDPCHPQENTFDFANPTTLIFQKELKNFGQFSGWIATSCCFFIVEVDHSLLEVGQACCRAWSPGHWFHCPIIVTVNKFLLDFLH